MRLVGIMVYYDETKMTEVEALNQRMKTLKRSEVDEYLVEDFDEDELEEYSIPENP